MRSGRRSRRPWPIHPPGSLEEQWDPDGLSHALEHEFLVSVDVSAKMIKEDTKLNADGIRERCVAAVQKAYEEEEQSIGAALMRLVEKEVMLKQLDLHWKEHLAAMDYLRQGIGLRGYAQKNPKQEYKREAFEMFGEMLDQVKHDTISIPVACTRAKRRRYCAAWKRERRSLRRRMEFKHDDGTEADVPGTGASCSRSARVRCAAAAAGRRLATVAVRARRTQGRAGTKPVPCGSGKKFKQCHGRLS